VRRDPPAPPILPAVLPIVPPILPPIRAPLPPILKGLIVMDTEGMDGEVVLTGFILAAGLKLVRGGLKLVRGGLKEAGGVGPPPA